MPSARMRSMAISRAWRNWQTRRAQNPFLATECRFDPDRPHHCSLRGQVRGFARHAEPSRVGLPAADAARQIHAVHVPRLLDRDLVPTRLRRARALDSCCLVAVCPAARRRRAPWVSGGLATGGRGRRPRSGFWPPARSAFAWTEKLFANDYHSRIVRRVALEKRPCPSRPCPPAACPRPARLRNRPR